MSDKTINELRGAAGFPLVPQIAYDGKPALTHVIAYADLREAIAYFEHAQQIDSFTAKRLTAFVDVIERDRGTAIHWRPL